MLVCYIQLPYCCPPYCWLRIPPQDEAAEDPLAATGYKPGTLEQRDTALDVVLFDVVLSSTFPVLTAVRTPFRRTRRRRTPWRQYSAAQGPICSCTGGTSSWWVGGRIVWIEGQGSVHGCWLPVSCVQSSLGCFAPLWAVGRLPGTYEQPDCLCTGMRAL